jgi:hypothetical protein
VGQEKPFSGIPMNARRHGYGTREEYFFPYSNMNQTISFEQKIIIAAINISANRSLKDIRQIITNASALLIITSSM